MRRIVTAQRLLYDSLRKRGVRGTARRFRRMLTSRREAQKLAVN